MNLKSKKITVAAIIAAMYAVLTMVLSFSSYGVIQFRVAEALTVLPFFSPIFIPAVFIGCLISNLLSPVGILDIVFGSLATLIGAIITYYIGKSNFKIKRYLAPMPAVVINAVIIGVLLHYTLELPLILSMIQVGFGELVCCYILGLPLLMYIERNETLKKYFS
jgi:uncharacterized membrane protein